GRCRRCHKHRHCHCQTFHYRLFLHTISSLSALKYLCILHIFSF
ncbi:hypothetical protein CLOSTASPAR_05111, partial [[Clostridium] asparagiforme DSM 15981]